MLPSGDKYVVRLVEDTESMLEEMQMGGGGGERPEPRVQFEILPAGAAQPAATAGWQRGAAALLLILTLASTLQFGLAANIGLLPKASMGRRASQPMPAFRRALGRALAAARGSAGLLAGA